MLFPFEADKIFKSHTFNTCNLTTMSKKQNLHTKFFDKNKPVKSTDHEAGMTDYTEFLLAFYKSNSQMRVLWSHCRALLIA
jgi:hypothetical protein